jgi:DNA-binding HxlR family transcriptional regulator
MAGNEKRLPNKVKEKDYRLGKGPTERADSARRAILAALKQGKERFRDLENETELSRPALASNLKEMNRRGLIERKTDSEDYRITRYSLTEKGLKEYEKQKDIETLENMESISVGSALEIIKNAILHAANFIQDGHWSQHELRRVDSENHDVPHQADNGVYVTRKTEGLLFPSLSNEEQDILRKCLVVKMYSNTAEGETPGFAETLRELMMLVKQVAASKNVDIEEIKKLPNLTLMFQFSRDFLIYQYEQMKSRNAA